MSFFTQEVDITIPTDEDDYVIDNEQLLSMYYQVMENSNLVTDFRTIKMTHRTKKLWNKLKKLKYKIISSMVIDPKTICKEVIDRAHDVLEENRNMIYIYWSLISQYDDLYSNNRDISPRDYIIKNWLFRELGIRM
jgi:hypothetical protein